MSLHRRQESPPTSRGGVPAPADDAIDAIVEAVSSGARMPTGSSHDSQDRAAPAITLSSATASSWMGAHLARRTAPILIAFGVGLGGAVWSLRTFEFNDRPADAPGVRIEPQRPPVSPRRDPLPSHDLRPLTTFASRSEARPFDRTAAASTPAGAPLDAAVTAAPARRAPRNETTRVAPPPPLVATLPEPIAAAPAVPTAIVRDASPAPVNREAATIDAVALDAQAVRDTADHYAQALERLDVNAAAALWPTVDRRALSRAFSSLKSQELAFDDCDVALESTTATARCQGTAEYVVKIGTARARAGRFEWLFRMRKQNDAWKIEAVAASQTGTVREQQ